MHLRSVTFYPQKYPCEDRYPFNLPTFRQTEQIHFTTPVTLFVGENGTGKSTLMEALARRCRIHIWRDTERIRFENNPYEDRFGDYISVEWTAGQVPGSFFGSSVFQDFVRALDEWAANDPGQLKYFGGKSLVTQSHGQSLMSFFRSRYQIKGLYLLDEPETALSPTSQLGLLDILAAMGAAGHAQFIVATHSPILLACPGATIYSFDHIPIQTVAYEETGHYRLYRSFMEDPHAYLSGDHLP
jgi:predicted ATPase